MRFLGHLLNIVLLQQATVVQLDDIESVEGANPCKKPKIDGLLRRTIEPSSDLLLFNGDLMWEYDFERKKLGHAYRVDDFWPEVETPISDATLLKIEKNDSLISNKVHAIFVQGRKIWVYEYKDFKDVLDSCAYMKLTSDKILAYVKKKQHSEIVRGVSFDEHEQGGELRTRISMCKDTEKLLYCFWAKDEPCKQVRFLKPDRGRNCGPMEIYKGTREDVEAVVIATGDKLRTYVEDERGLLANEEYSVKQVYGCEKKYLYFIVIGSLLFGCVLLLIGTGSLILVFKRRNRFTMLETNSITRVTSAVEQKSKMVELKKGHKKLKSGLRH